jgi:hypothetical protein
MTNDNCLDGIECPTCGNEDQFRIEITIMASVTDDGVEIEYGHTEWDKTSYAECAECCKHGTVADFTAQSEPPPEAAPQLASSQELSPSPGPWEYGEHVEGYAVLDAKRELVAYCDYWSHPDDANDSLAHPAEANARLIASAPTLLAALSNLLGDTDYDAAGTCIGCGRERGEGEHLRCAGYWNEIERDCPRAYARAALTKTKGGAQ